jgi:hypothetical protein
VGSTEARFSDFLIRDHASQDVGRAFSDALQLRSFSMTASHRSTRIAAARRLYDDWDWSGAATNGAVPIADMSYVRLRDIRSAARGVSKKDRAPITAGAENQNTHTHS